MQLLVSSPDKKDNCWSPRWKSLSDIAWYYVDPRLADLNRYETTDFVCVAIQYIKTHIQKNNFCAKFWFPGIYYYLLLAELYNL